jgi:hypothetical protein
MQEQNDDIVGRIRNVRKENEQEPDKPQAVEAWNPLAVGAGHGFDGRFIISFRQ